MNVSIHTVILGNNQLIVEQIVSGLLQVGFAPDWVLLDSGAACIQHLEQHHDTVDVVLVDASLQDIDPTQVGQLFNTRWREIPVVVVVGSPNEELQSDYAEQGIADVMSVGDLQRIGSILLDAQRRRRPQSGGRVLAAFDVLAGLIERLPISVAVVGLDGAIQYINRAFSLLTGHASDAATRMTLGRLIAGRSDLDLWNRIVESVTASGEWQGDMHGRRRTGEAYQAVAIVTPIQSADGPVTGYLVMGHDVTEQTRMMNALRVSEQRFQALVQASPLAIVVHDQEGRISIWNPAAERIFGWQVDEAIGRMYVDLTVPDHARAEHFALRDRALQGESIDGIEARRRKKDGTVTEVSLSTAALRDARDAIVGVMAVIADVSEHKQAVNQSRQSEERFRRLIENASDLLSILDAESGAILYESPSARRILGYAPDEMIGQNVFTFVHPDDLAQVRDVFGSLIERPRLPVKAEARFRRKDGSWAFLEAIGRLAPELGGVVVNSWDITERKRVEDEIRALNDDLEQRVADRMRELAQANERLQELDRLKSKFVSDVSHELLTPITNMNLYLSVLERAEVGDYPTHIGALREHARQLMDLVEDILDLSRLERDREYATFTPVDLNVVARQMVEAHRVRAVAAGLSLVFEPENDLPAVLGNPDMLMRVVANLLTNAVNYTPRGMVRVSTHHENGRVCLLVEDTGIGIDAEDLPNVFERFYRGRRSARLEVPGTGLGLSIVQEIVAMHNGEIHLKSHADEGSTLSVCLPCTVDCQSDGVATSSLRH